MAWSVLGTQFCLELAFGVLLGLIAIHRAPLGPFFFRLMVTTALLPVSVVAVVPTLFAGGSWGEPTTVCALVALIAYPFASGPISASRRRLALVAEIFEPIGKNDSS